MNFLKIDNSFMCKLFSPIMMGAVLILNISCSKPKDAPRNFKLNVSAMATASGIEISGGAILKLVETTNAKELIIELKTAPFIAIIPNGTWDIYLMGFTGPNYKGGTAYCGSEPAKKLTGNDIEITIEATKANCANIPFTQLNPTAGSSVWDSALWDNATWGQ